MKTKQLPHPNAVYAVIVIAVLLSLTVFTPANINAAVTGLNEAIKGQNVELTVDITDIVATSGEVTNNAVVTSEAAKTTVKLCGDMCGDVNKRIGVYAILNGNVKCVSIEEFMNNRYCCFDFDCPDGSSCANGVCE